MLPTSGCLLRCKAPAHLAVSWDSLGPGHDVSLDKPWYNQPTIFWLALTARIPLERRAAVLAHWDQVFRNDREVMTEATADPAVKAALLRVKTGASTAQRERHDGRRFTVPLTLLMALSASIFLVGCLNLANLQLARLHARAHELECADGAWGKQRQAHSPDCS